MFDLRNLSYNVGNYLIYLVEINDVISSPESVYIEINIEEGMSVLVVIVTAVMFRQVTPAAFS